MPAVSKRQAILDAFHAHIYKIRRRHIQQRIAELTEDLSIDSDSASESDSSDISIPSISSVSSVSDDSSVGSHTSTESETLSDITHHIEAHRTNRIWEFRHLLQTTRILEAGPPVSKSSQLPLYPGHVPMSQCMD